MITSTHRGAALRNSSSSSSLKDKRDERARVWRMETGRGKNQATVKMEREEIRGKQDGRKEIKRSERAKMERRAPVIHVNVTPLRVTMLASHERSNLSAALPKTDRQTDRQTEPADEMESNISWDESS